MLRRPLVLWLISIGLLLTPFYYYAERVMLSGRSWADPVGVIAEMPMLKLVAAVMAVPVGALLLRVHPLSWYGIFAYGVYTISANLALYLQGRVQLSFMLLFAATGFAAVLFFTRREIVSPFFNPRLRGWESDRLRYRAQAEILLPSQEKVEAHSWDISPSGLYLETTHSFSVGSVVEMTLFLEPEKTLNEQVEVVWVSPGDGERPAGVGVRFVRDIRDSLEQTLKRVTKRTFARVPFKLRVDIEGKETVSCETFDLSRMGCYLVTDQPFTIGESLKLTLHLDGPLAIEGTVVRVATSPRGVGVRFNQSPLRLQSALKNFHARRAEVARSV